MKSREMLRISREEDRAGALRARVHRGLRGVPASVLVRNQRGEAALPAEALS